MPNVIKGFQGEHRFLSNFWSCLDPAPSVEHHYQAAKAWTEKDRNWILSSQTPGIAKYRGKKILLRGDFESIKLTIMKSLLRRKFADPDLKQRLLDTGNAELIEINWWHDNFWGACECNKCGKEKKENNLGKLLMEIRNDLNPNRGNVHENVNET